MQAKRRWPKKVAGKFGLARQLSRPEMDHATCRHHAEYASALHLPYFLTVTAVPMPTSWTVQIWTVPCLAREDA